MNHESLQIAIVGNPAYAESLAKGNDAAIAEDLAKPGGSVALETLPRAKLAAALTGGLLALKGESPRWSLALQLLASFDTTLSLADEAVQGILAAAVEDSLLTQEQVTALTTRPGTKAELAFGAGVRVTDQDVAKALNPIRATLLDESLTKVKTKTEEQDDVVN